MEELTNLSEKALHKYFNNLSKLGYLNDSEVSSILVLLFLEETLDREFSMFVTEDDYRIIQNSLSCLFENSCIGFPDYNTYDELVHKCKLYLTPRISEDCILRYTQDNYIRGEAQ